MSATEGAVYRLNELIEGIEFAMLTTVRTDGSLHSCPMATSQVDADEILWFLSDTDTEKVEALRTDRRVNVSYADPVAGRYVSITGVCQLVRDHEKAKALWTPLYKAWFPKGIEDPNLILLKVHVLQAEYWDAPENRMVEVRGWAESTAASKYSSAVHETASFSKDLNR
jgi:general stress protein 26